MQTQSNHGAVVHVVQHLRPGGLEVMALELARMQSERRETLVVSLEGEADAAIAAWPRLAEQRHQLIFLGKRPGLDGLLLPRLVRLFRALRPSAVHTHHIGPLLYAGAAARLAGVPCRIHTEHDAWHLSDPRRRRVARLALAAARPILVADAPHVATAVADELGCARPRVILNGIDTERFTPATRPAAPDGESAVIGIAARLEPVKGVDIGLRAFAAMQRPARLVIAGTGSQEDALRRLAADLGIAGRVTFLGHVDAMADFYRTLDVLLLPSRSEGLPLSLLEAQACGVPVVAADVGGVAAAVCPATGRLVAGEDVAGFAQALDALVAGRPGDPRPFVLQTASLRRAADAYLALCGAASGTHMDADHNSGWLRDAPRHAA